MLGDASNNRLLPAFKPISDKVEKPAQCRGSSKTSCHTKHKNVHFVYFLYFAIVTCNSSIIMILALKGLSLMCV